MHLAALFPQISIVGFCGIIGVGKSTALEKLKHQDIKLGSNVQIAFVQEPAAEWRQKGWLQAYYDQPDTNALSFQMLVFMSHVETIHNAISPYTEWIQEKKENHLIVITERTMYDQLLFWKTQCDMNFQAATPLSDEAYTIAWKHWNWFLPEIKLLLFFRTTDINTTMKRIQQRGRDEEQGVSLEYQNTLLQKHEAWYTTPNAHPMHAPTQGIACVHIDADRNYAQDEKETQKLKNVIEEAIQKNVL